LSKTPQFVRELFSTLKSCNSGSRQWKG